jgi:hypothetical protein
MSITINSCPCFLQPWQIVCSNSMAQHTSHNRPWFQRLLADAKDTLQGHSSYHVHSMLKCLPLFVDASCIPFCAFLLYTQGRNDSVHLYCSCVTLPTPFAVPSYSGSWPAHMSIDKRWSTKGLMSWEEITDLCAPESLNLIKLLAIVLLPLALKFITSIYTCNQI